MWNLRVSVLGVAAVMAFTAQLQAEPDFAGTWDTTFGPMFLHHEKGNVAGFYQSGGHFCKISGPLAKSQWKFVYHEPTVQGEGHFDLAADGQTISGQWRPHGTEAWLPWTGRRAPDPAAAASFNGVWNTSYGRMRLNAGKDAVGGCYSVPFGSTISGKLEGRRFSFEYHEPHAQGEGWLELAADGRSFHGLWRPEGTEPWLDWFGVRAEPTPGKSWLVIVEAHWEHDLAEPEYSFGDMLRAFFARTPGVQVRHRYVNSGQDIARACHEVTYLTEPVVLSLSSHGTAAGITVNGETVGADALAQSLRFASNVRLLHFSSCSVMGDRLPRDIMSAKGMAARFPISGYTQAVDWAGSAVLEFLYFDMILSRGLSPEKASRQVRLLVPFSGDEPIPGSLIAPTGFRILSPDK